MDQPKIPTLKDSQKPQVKIKGLAAGLSLFDRLKQFKKKDLAFILAGLGTLFMAPLAEHFMMAPENGDGTMTQGWGGKGGSNLFGTGASPYESGITGLAPGGAIGGGGDVITPLNVRDPSALVMGPGSQQQPPAGSMAPTAPPPSSKEPDLKDALANAAARAAGAATRRAPVPVPKPGMTGSGLRGLGVISGGSSAGAGLAPINSNGLAPRGAAGSNSLGDVRPTSNYRGVAGARGPGKGSNIEALKGAAGGAGGLFNQGGGAGNALEAAASQAIPNGNAFGGGNGGAGGNDKGPGGNNSPGSKSVGESLEFLRQKSEMEKAIDLKWKMKEKKAMFPLELGQEAAKTAVMKGVVEPLSGMMGDLIKNSFPGSTQGISCNKPQQIFVPGSKLVNSAVACDSAKDPGSYYFSNGILKKCGGSTGGEYTECSYKSSASSGDSSGAASERAGTPGSYTPVDQGGTGYQGMDLSTICQKLQGMTSASATQASMLTLARRTVVGYEAMSGGANAAKKADCSGATGAAGHIIPDSDLGNNLTNIDAKQLNVRDTLLKNALLDTQKALLGIKSGVGDPMVSVKSKSDTLVGAKTRAAYDPARKELGTTVETNLAAAGKNVEGVKPTLGEPGASGKEGTGVFKGLDMANKTLNGGGEAKGTKDYLAQVKTTLPKETEVTALKTDVDKVTAGGSTEAKPIYDSLLAVVKAQNTKLTALEKRQGELDNLRTTAIQHANNAQIVLENAGKFVKSADAALTYKPVPDAPVASGAMIGLTAYKAKVDAMPTGASDETAAGEAKKLEVPLKSVNTGAADIDGQSTFVNGNVDKSITARDAIK